MLIQTPYVLGDTVSLKLLSGEEVVGRLENESKDGYTLVKPLMLTAMQQGVGLAPFMFTIDDDAKVEIKATAVTCIVKTSKDTADSYIQSTTGIAV
jgi:hypothetical protein